MVIEINLINFQISVFVSFLLIFIKTDSNNKFVDLLKISDGNYFVVFNWGIYIYDKNFGKKNIITTNNNYIFSAKIAEYIYDDEIYIISYIGYYYIYIYNYNSNNLNTYDYYEYSDEYNKDFMFSNSKGENYALKLIKKSENNENLSYRQSFIYYYLNFSNEVNKHHLIGDCKSNCHIFSNSTTLRCFFNDQEYIYNVIYNISFSGNQFNLIKESDFFMYFEKANTTFNFNNFDFAVSKNSNIFICYYIFEKEYAYTLYDSYWREEKKYYNYYYTICVLNYNFINYTEIPCIYVEECSNYKTFDFQEQDEFVLLCKLNKKFVLSIIKNKEYPEFENNKCIIKTISINCKYYDDYYYYSDDYDGEYSLIYNDTLQDYILIIDDNFTQSKKCILNNENTIEYQFKDNITFNKTKYDFQDENVSNSIYNNFDLISTSSIKNIEEEKIEKIIIEESVEEIINNVTEFIKDKEIGKNYKIEGEGFSLIIKPTNSTAFENSTRVDFEKCEQLLREKYNISNSSIITFFQMELTNNDENALYNQIKYFTYDDKKQELNLSLCEDIKTKIHFMLKNGSNLDKSTINKFKNLGVDIFNIKDEFFTDLCFSYSDSNNDMILEDIIKYIYQNYSLCEEEGCTYNNIDIEKMSITCDCKIQGNFSSITTSLVDDQANEVSFLDSNIGVVKCYKLVFSFKNKSSNIGFILFTILIIVYIIFFCFLIKRGAKPISDFVFNEMKKFGYLNKDQNTNSEKGKEKNKERLNAENQTVANPKKKGRGKKKKKFKKFAGNKGKSLEIKMNMETNEEEKNERGNKESIITNLKFFNNFVINNNNNSSKENDSKMDNFGIIKVNINESIKEYMPEDSNQTLHNYTYEEAIKYDKRNIFRIFYIYLLSKQIIFHTFLLRSPLELFSLRFTLFIFMLSCDLALNSLFYLNDNISKKYHYAKNLFLFAFSNNITIIIYSTLLSYVLITLMTKLSNTSNAIRKVFRKEEEKIKHKKGYKIKEETKKEIYSEILNIFKKYKIKLIILFTIEIILILFFWYFVTAFCHVYSSTQTSWLLDSFLSILSRFIMELIFAFLYGKLYQISVASNFETLYKIVLFLYDFTI